jgi:hypothetical protein
VHTTTRNEIASSQLSIFVGSRGWNRGRMTPFSIVAGVGGPTQAIT